MVLYQKIKTQCLMMEVCMNALNVNSHMKCVLTVRSELHAKEELGLSIKEFTADIMFPNGLGKKSAKITIVDKINREDLIKQGKTLEAAVSPDGSGYFLCDILND